MDFKKRISNNLIKGASSPTKINMMN